MIILSIIGLFLAAVVWQNVHPVVGILVGFLFVGGAGWKLLLGLLTMLRPSAKAAYGAPGREFIAAWEQMNGPMRRGVEGSLPPPNSFQQWKRANGATGISAEAWLRKANSNLRYKVPVCWSPLIPTMWGGEDTGELAVFDDGGLMFFGQRIKVELQWESFAQWAKCKNPDAGLYCLDLKPGMGASVFVLAGGSSEDVLRFMTEAKKHVPDRKLSDAS